MQSYRRTFIAKCFLKVDEKQSGRVKQNIRRTDKNNLR